MKFDKNYNGHDLITYSNKEYRLFHYICQKCNLIFYEEKGVFTYIEGMDENNNGHMEPSAHQNILTCDVILIKNIIE